MDQCASWRRSISPPKPSWDPSRRRRPHRSLKPKTDLFSGWVQIWHCSLRYYFWCPRESGADISSETSRWIGCFLRRYRGFSASCVFRNHIAMSCPKCHKTHIMKNDTFVFASESTSLRYHAATVLLMFNSSWCNVWRNKFCEITLRSTAF